MSTVKKLKKKKPNNFYIYMFWFEMQRRECETMANYTQIKARLPRLSTINEKDQNVQNKYKMPQIYKNPISSSTYTQLLHVGIIAKT